MEKEHETDYQRARRQRHEVKKYGITGSTSEEAKKNIKEHVAKKMSMREGGGRLRELDRLKKWGKNVNEKGKDLPTLKSEYRHWRKKS